MGLAPWTGPVDIKRKVKRIEEIDTGLARCHALNAPKLREQVGARLYSCSARGWE